MDHGRARAAGVFVFAPTLFLSVTLERRGDSDELHLHPGGQGLWIARMLKSLGVDVVLCGPAGGETGLVARTLVAHEGIPVIPVEVGSWSGSYVHDRRAGDRTVLAEMPPQPLSRHELDELYGAAVVAALERPVSVLGGPHDPSPVPPDVYRRLASDIRSGTGDGRVVADLSGPPLDAVLDGRVHVLKVSHEDLIEDGRATGDGIDELAAAADELQRRGAANVVVSRGDQPALLLTGDDAYEVAAPALEAADPTGAGDSMTAGIAAGLVEDLGIVDAVRFGAAAGALNATRHGKGTGDRSQVERLAQRVEVCPLRTSPGTGR
jgi:1-phosphofructokinase